LATAELETEEDRSRLLITIWPEADDEDQSSEDDEVEGVSDEIALAVLVECRIVLTEGRFVDAVGFEIVDGGRAVKLAEVDFDDEDSGKPLVLSLTWMPEREPGKAQ
jgi:hypothetical protein